MPKRYLSARMLRAVFAKHPEWRSAFKKPLSPHHLLSERRESVIASQVIDQIGYLIKGRKDSVTIPFSYMHKKWLIHNHPGGKMSLSFDDLKVMHDKKVEVADVLCPSYGMVFRYKLKPLRHWDYPNDVPEYRWLVEVRMEQLFKSPVAKIYSKRLSKLRDNYGIDVEVIPFEKYLIFKESPHVRAAMLMKKSRNREKWLATREHFKRLGAL